MSLSVDLSVSSWYDSDMFWMECRRNGLFVLKALYQVLSLVPVLNFDLLIMVVSATFSTIKTLSFHIIFQFITRHLPASFSTHGSCLKQLLVWRLPVWWHSVLFFTPAFISWHFYSKEELSHSSVYSFVLFQYWTIIIRLSSGFQSVAGSMYLDAQVVPDFQGNRFRYTPAFFRCVPVMLALPCWSTAKWSRFIHCFSCPYSWVSHLSKEP